ncbi:MAG: hypothetical protein LBI72_02190 [Flavobacteriaceae bacterium]|jgi:hypothetical protein|nr:hypothetical protein [Flavobacteriaceae bacterium]
MKNIIVCLVLSIVSWLYYFYERKKATQNEEGDWIDRFWKFGLDFKILLMAIGTAFLTIYFIIDYFRK